MSIGSGFDAAFVIATVGGLGIAAAIIIIGTQLLSSARAANYHLATAMQLAPPPAATGEMQRPNAARPVDSGPPQDAGSQQIFAQLNQYYAANISQGNTIFWASLLSMSIGFAIIFVGIVTAGAHSTTALVAGIAGVLSQFIAATFIVALRSTQQQATTYAQTLVELRLRDVRAAADAQSVTLGLRLLGEISADGADALANQTRAAIATGLIVKDGVPFAPPAPIVPASVDVDAPARIGPPTQPRTRAESVSFDTSQPTGPQRPAQHEEAGAQSDFGPQR